MAAGEEDNPSATSTPAAEDASSPGVRGTPMSTGSMILLSSALATAILTGFALTMRASRREGDLPLPPKAERPSRLALRALGLGTLGAIAGTGTLCVSLSCALGIKELKDLRPRMNELLTPFALKAERLSRRVSVKAEALGNALNRRFNLSEKVRRDRSKPKNDD